MKEINIIEIWWEGPFTKKEVQNEHDSDDKDYGIYQIYGTHNISGPNTLLYIGKASEQTFAKRIKQHDWTEWESTETKFFIGRLGGLENIDENEWKRQIDNAERLLIYFCTPSYNSSGIVKYDEMPETIVFNLNKNNRLPLEVSTLYEKAKGWGDEWNYYQVR